MKYSYACVGIVALVAMMFVGCNHSDSDRDLTAGSDTTPSMIVSDDDSNGQDRSGAAIENVLNPEEAQEIVRNGVMEFDEGMRSDDEAVRQATFDRFMPTKDHLSILFGEDDAQKIWSRLEPELARLRGQTNLLKSESERNGDLLGVEVIDVRTNDVSGRYQDVLKGVPESIPVFRVLKQFNSGESGSSSYVVIGGKMVFVRGLEGMYEFLQSPEAQ